ncbi:universal stress protein [Herminiimonas fonticola]|uniref:Universal stress protein family protein n=1 Tax=Herminiimonas fonticola TaxID=303380 RepID=A0A4R6G124_9BURK|nr:universal stress protein [Herminiimonas fonticola]RBA23627.1 Universal stress protein family [Herminiimonas fonticola]TDN88033.1 universal stress protein family protein [Herminiimonas fonticola]
MSYKVILVHLEHALSMQKCVEVAITLANQEDAHLVGVATTGISRFVYNDHSDLFDKAIATLTERAKQLLDDFEGVCRTAGVRSYETKLIHDDAAAGLIEPARYCDLVIVSQAAQETIQLISPIPEYVMLNSARPVLVIPNKGKPVQLDGHILISWNESPEATRAITYALPLLKRAREITVGIFQSSSRYGVLSNPPGSDVATWLGRHGINVDIVEEYLRKDIDEAILELAAQRESGLIVMGGYGHARFRELFVGGATIDILNNSTIPILIAH